MTMKDLFWGVIADESFSTSIFFSTHNAYSEHERQYTSPGADGPRLHPQVLQAGTLWPCYRRTR